MIIDKKFIDDKIRFLINSKGISKKEMIMEIVKSKEYLDMIKKKEILPSLNDIILVCEYFGITLQEFFDVENKNPNESRKLLNDIKSLDKSTLQALSTIIDAINKKN